MEWARDRSRTVQAPGRDRGVRQVGTGRVRRPCRATPARTVRPALARPVAGGRPRHGAPVALGTALVLDGEGHLSAAAAGVDLLVLRVAGELHLDARPITDAWW